MRTPAVNGSAGGGLGAKLVLLCGPCECGCAVGGVGVENGLVFLAAPRAANVCPTCV